MKRKRVTTLAIILALLLALAGCGGGTATTQGQETTKAAAKTTASPEESTAAEEETSAEAETDAADDQAPGPVVEGDTLVLTMFEGSPLTATTPAWDTEIGKKITELTGVRVEVEYLVGQDIMTKANLMTATGDYPDLIMAGDNPGIFIAANAFIQLDDLIEQYGTNIKKIYRPSELTLMKLQNEAIYTIATYRPSIENLYPSAGFYIAYDILKANDFPVIKTLSQYKDLLISYIEENPEYNGAENMAFTIATEGWRVSALQYGGARFLGGYPNDGPTVVNQETLEATIAMRNDFNKIFLGFMNEIWNLGYFDKEAFMQTDDQFKAKLSSGNILGVYDQRGPIQDAINAMDADPSKHDRTLVAFPIILDSAEREYYRGPYAFTTNGIAISSSCKDPETAFKFLDRMAADDIQKLNYWGVEGEDYTLVDGKFTRSTEQWMNSFNSDYTREKGIGQFGNFPHRENTDDEVYGKTDDGNWMNPAMNQEYNDVRYKDYEKEILKNYGIDTFCDFFEPAYPARYQTGWSVRQQMPQDSVEFIAVQKALDLATEYHAKLIQAAPDQFDALWDEYMSKMDAIEGLDAYEKKVTEVIQDSAQYYQN